VPLAAGDVDVKGWAAGHKKLALGDSGVLYEDELVQLGAKTQYAGAVGRFLLFLGNKSAGPLSGVSLALAAVPPGLRAQVLEPLPASVGAGQQVQAKAAVALGEPGEGLPRLALRFVDGAGGAHAREAALPCPPPKFVSPVAGVTPGAFFPAWKAAPARAQRSGQAGAPLTPERVGAALARAGLGAAAGVDPNPGNGVGAGTLATERLGGLQVLARVEVEPAQQLRFRVTAAVTAGTAGGAGAPDDGALRAAAEWQAAVLEAALLL